MRDARQILKPERSDTGVVAFVDADYAEDFADSKSMSEGANFVQ